MKRRERGPSRYLKVEEDPHRGPFPLPRCGYVWCGSSLVPHWFHALVPLVPRFGASGSTHKSPHPTPGRTPRWDGLRIQASAFARVMDSEVIPH